MLRLLVRIARSHCGRALLAWCALLTAAQLVTAQFPAFDKPPVGMDPEREVEFSEPGPYGAFPSGEDPQFENGARLGTEESIITSDDGEQEVVVDDAQMPPPGYDYGPEVGPRFGAPYDYIGEQGLPFIMQQEGGAYRPGSYYNPDEPGPPPRTYCRCMTWLGFRHSYTHGRNVGWGLPLVGSSWLNRPIYVGATLGPMWLTNRPIDSVARDKDVMGSLIFGWDWDYYWGSEFQYGYATPELWNSAAPPGSPLGHRLATWNYSLMYYPWGDANLRPFWRLGVGNTHFDFTTDDGMRRDEWLLTTPFGVGFKYSFRRWLAGRIEFTDQLSWGDHGVATQHNLVLQFGLEMRFGAKRKAYWPWNPSRHIW